MIIILRKLKESDTDLEKKVNESKNYRIVHINLFIYIL